MLPNLCCSKTLHNVFCISGCLAQTNTADKCCVVTKRNIIGLFNVSTLYLLCVKIKELQGRIYVSTKYLLNVLYVRPAHSGRWPIVGMELNGVSALLLQPPGCPKLNSLNQRRDKSHDPF